MKEELELLKQFIKDNDNSTVLDQAEHGEHEGTVKIVKWVYFSGSRGYAGQRGGIYYVESD